MPPFPFAWLSIAIVAAFAPVSLSLTLGRVRHRWTPIRKNASGPTNTDQLPSPTDQLSYPVRAMFEQLAPEACACTIDHWDQYAICEKAAAKSTNAFSFGVMGYDVWGQHVQAKYNIVPELFDCFDHRKPADFESKLFPVCLGAEEGNFHGRTYETLPQLLKGTAKNEASVLVKIDIERDEYEVLGNMTGSDFQRLSGLNVEYHLNYGCPDSNALKKILRVMQHVRAHLAVIDSAADYYGDNCFVGGTPLPKLFAVSYAARSLCTAA